MSIEKKQTRSMSEYSQELAETAKRAAKRIISRKQSMWLVVAEREYEAYRNMVQEWIKEFEGSDYERKLFTAFLQTSTKVFWEIVLGEMDAEVARKEADPDFNARFQAFKKTYVPSPEVRAKEPPIVSLKEELPEIRYRSLDDITAALVKADPDYPDWLVKKAGDTTTEVLVVLHAQKTAEDALRMFERCIDHFRVKLWDRVRAYKPYTEPETILNWLNRITATAAHYTTVVLSGASRNVLPEDEAKLFEKQIATLRQKYALEMYTMNTQANNAPSTAQNDTGNTGTPSETTQTTAQPAVEMINDMPAVNLHELAQRGEVDVSFTLVGEAGNQPLNEAVNETLDFGSQAEEAIPTVQVGVFRRVKAFITSIPVKEYFLTALVAILVGLGAFFGVKYLIKDESAGDKLKAIGQAIKTFAAGVVEKVKGWLPQRSEAPSTELAAAV